ncbi:hypothetical protein HNV08_09805 [Winogradskyella eckloniae]|uniref:hypothetical protein n=1 Tax=Winogradskyella eckloniae TaxID=1089306 RepID=UPI001564F607|nr:hypothetical protein [Winogradskyella eckloniae]NRD20340.1 hypothetical protein [Winogradskyella eckloniae]
MIRRILLLICFAFIVACDDGDILTIDLEFDGELARCDNNINSYLLYDTRTSPNEALMLIIDRDDENELLFTEATTSTLTIDENNTRFILRSYNRSIESDELCDEIPPGDLNIVEDYEADSGTVNITSTIIDDDNDGIPSEDEYGPGGIDDPQDSDGDGLPDYKDDDDDNDNVRTALEIDVANADGDDDPLTNGLDTDEDGTLDYLDDDDDDDGVLTRLEDASIGQNPRAQENIVADAEDIDTYRYLYNHTSANDPYEDSGFILSTYTRSVTTSFIIENAGFDIINSTYIDYGDFEISYTVTYVPETTD